MKLFMAVFFGLVVYTLGCNQTESGSSNAKNDDLGDLSAENITAENCKVKQESETIDVIARAGKKDKSAIRILETRIDGQQCLKFSKYQIKLKNQVKQCAGKQDVVKKLEEKREYICTDWAGEAPTCQVGSERVETLDAVAGAQAGDLLSQNLLKRITKINGRNATCRKWNHFNLRQKLQVEACGAEVKEKIVEVSADSSCYAWAYSPQPQASADPSPSQSPAPSDLPKTPQNQPADNEGVPGGEPVDPPKPPEDGVTDGVMPEPPDEPANPPQEEVVQQYPYKYTVDKCEVTVERDGIEYNLLEEAKGGDQEAASFLASRFMINGQVSICRDWKFATMLKEKISVSCSYEDIVHKVYQPIEYKYNCNSWQPAP